MNLRIVLAFGAVLVASLGYSQTASGNPKSVDDTNKVLYNIAKLNTTKFVLPLLLKKAQINELLLAMEKIKSSELKVRDAEAKELLKLDPEITKAVTAAVEKGSYPPRELQSQIIKIQQGIINTRQIFVAANIESLDAICKKVLDEGQLKTMVNIMDPRSFDPSAQPDKMTDDDKRRFYIKTVFLDAITYELLKVMYKKAAQ